ncbi:hypothetical protein WN51_04078 [Melipona quadrifasciata]|uniref:Uncharacterized protein n=1 Tax=Melipona quadrifasciata TaxID=166423 RepID=A0A0N0BC77_9HYME|nr:hypothetical protein WN51_04078 [Melipona quadrifasciata]
MHRRDNNTSHYERRKLRTKMYRKKRNVRNENRSRRKKRYVRLQDTNISSVGSDRILGVVPLARDPVADIRNEDYLV